MTKILIQNTFHDYENEGYFLACKPYGEIYSGDFIILEESDLKIEIVEVEDSAFGDILISVREMPISLINISQLYNKEFLIQKADVNPNSNVSDVLIEI